MIAKVRRRYRREVGFRFDALSVFLLCQQWGVDLDGMKDIPRDAYVSSWVWNAHRSYCMYQYKKPLFTTHDKMRWYIDRLSKKDWDIIVKAMVESRPPDSDDKKKVNHGENSLSQDGRQE